MDKAALLALADRVEALTGPRFNIEDQIEKVARLPWRFPPPNYTASLDAAMTLVPGSTGRYAHLDDQQVLDAAEQIGACIDTAMGKGESK